MKARGSTRQGVPYLHYDLPHGWGMTVNTRTKQTICWCLDQGAGQGALPLPMMAEVYNAGKTPTAGDTPDEYWGSTRVLREALATGFLPRNREQDVSRRIDELGGENLRVTNLVYASPDR